MVNTTRRVLTLFLLCILFSGCNNSSPTAVLEQARQQRGIDTPSAGEVRRWLDPAGTRGLTPEVEDLLILVWCAWSGRTLQRSGRVFPTPRPGQLPDDVELLRPELPTPAEWAEALDRAGHLFGIALSGRALTARNLAACSEQVQAKAEGLTAAGSLVTALDQQVRAWADPADAPRLTTAKACAELLGQLRGSQGAALVRILAAFPPQTSITAMGRNLTTADTARRLLTERARWIVFGQVRNLIGDPGKGHRASMLLADLDALLSADEVNMMLADGLGELTRRAEELLRVEQPPPPPGWKTVLSRAVRVQDPAKLSQALRDLAAEVERAADGAAELRVDLSATVARRDPTP